MGRRKKLIRRSEIRNFENFFEEPSKYFEDKRPLVLELGCGKGEYTVELARKNKKKNFIGIDIKSDRIFVGAKKAIDEGLKNVCFIRTTVDYLERFFDKNSVDEIWITFPDPHPKKKGAKRRLTAGKYLQIYRQLLKAKGKIHLKTDVRPLVEFTIEEVEKNGGKILKTIWDLHSKRFLRSDLKIPTTFERKHILLGDKIHYLSFRLD
jgi:tRNA (guanine-N7-)-methyltransferase